MSNRCIQLTSAAFVATLTSLAGIVYHPTAISNLNHWPPKLAEVVDVATPPPEPPFTPSLYSAAISHPSKVDWVALLRAPNPEKWVWLLHIIAVPAVIALLLLVTIGKGLSRVPRARQAVALLWCAAADPAELAVQIFRSSSIATGKTQRCLGTLFNTHLEHTLYLIITVVLLCIQCSGGQHHPIVWRTVLCLPAEVRLMMMLHLRNDKNFLATALAAAIALVGFVAVPPTVNISPGPAALVVAGWWAGRFALDRLTERLSANGVRTKDAADSPSQDTPQV